MLWAIRNVDSFLRMLYNEHGDRVWMNDRWWKLVIVAQVHPGHAGLRAVKWVVVPQICPHNFRRYINLYVCMYVLLPSVLWRCWLGGRKGIRPVKNRVVGCWRSYLSGARCRLAYGPADATATHCLSCFSKIQIGFTFLVLAQRAIKRVCVRVRVRVRVCVCACWYVANVFIW